MLNEVHQAQKDKYHMISFLCIIQKNLISWKLVTRGYEEGAWGRDIGQWVQSYSETGGLSSGVLLCGVVKMVNNKLRLITSNCVSQNSYKRGF